MAILTAQFTPAVADHDVCQRGQKEEQHRQTNGRVDDRDRLLPTHDQDQIDQRGNSIILFVDSKWSNKNLDITINDEYLLTVNVGKKGEIRIKRNNKIGKTILNAMKLLCKAFA